MKVFRYFLLIALLLMVGTQVFAGVTLPVEEFLASADCDTVTITWGPEGDGGESYLDAESFPGGFVYVDENFEGSGGSETFPLIPALEDGDMLLVSVYRTADDDRYSETIIEVSCGSESSSEEVTTQIELCADGRTNVSLCEPLAIYPVDSEDGTGIIIYHIPRGTDIGEFMVYIAAEDLAALPDEVDSACTIMASANGFVVVYLLPTGEIQVNAGPDDDGKVFVYRYASFPSSPVIETYFGEALPILPSCFD